MITKKQYKYYVAKATKKEDDLMDAIRIALARKAKDSKQKQEVLL